MINPAAPKNRKWILFAAMCSILILLMSAVVINMFPSQEEMLTGISFSEEGQIGFRSSLSMGGGEYGAVSVIPVSAVPQLNQQRSNLPTYPKRIGLDLDGYRMIHWMPYGQAVTHPQLRTIVDLAYDSPPHSTVSLTSIRELRDVKDFAFGLLSDPDTFISAEYTESGGMLTNYRLYMLNIRKRIIIVLVKTT